MNTSLPFRILLGLAVVGGAAGCSAPFASDPDTYPPLATIQGRLAVDTGFTAPTTNTRIAVLWVSATKGQYKEAIDLPVQPVFPSQFKLELREPPPLEMFDPVNNSPGFKVSHGAVVAYEDLNQNGKLDLVDGISSRFEDRILGANGNLVLVYIDGSLPIAESLRDDPGRRLPPTLGYNIVSVGCDVTTPPNGPPTCVDSYEWKTMSDPYFLNLTNDPHLARLMCLTHTDTGLCAY
jgi:hypothetical protein